ncbi:GNAT family N-acetyltransferase [Chitinophaga pendula]|uniref:GNAT family N-acetyltransferase n=1 Tax=Chitinophaga TaxID=79328 RepID=UPI000BB01C17|nr:MULTISPECIES: GNAT family protein [Chitinophaga]ASZ10311.1 RimJ/RimL family protein N-acetyltransferase [Chitinophaga sp. MD30]UCJ06727.1 GNAT family N-acetyltransferase [Chitinophaga pendula]
MLELPVSDTIQLRQLQPEDAAPIYRLIDSSRKSLRKYLPWVDYNTNEEHSLRFIQLMERKAEEQDAIAFGMWSDGVLCGVIDLHDWDHLLQKAEIGYWVGEAHRGKGIATLCCKALISFAFRKLRLNKVEIRFALQNDRSAQIPIRLGLAKEGVLRHSAKLHGQYVDLVVMGVLREDWRY